jgi:hypothetical protein
MPVPSGAFRPECVTRRAPESSRRRELLRERVAGLPTDRGRLLGTARLSFHVNFTICEAADPVDVSRHRVDRAISQLRESAS